MNITTMNNQAVPGINAKSMDKPITASDNTSVDTSKQTALTSRADISHEGAISSYLANLSPEQKVEVNTFMNQLDKSKSAGSFDAKAMTAQAPSSINELSSILNVSTEQLLSQIPTEAAADVQPGVMTQANSFAVKTYRSVAQ